MVVARKRILPVAFAPVDALVIYLAFVAALKIRLGTWALMPAETGLEPAIVISVLTYIAALWLAGLYDRPPESMHLHSFLRTGAALFVAWAISLALTYIISPSHVPARSVTAAQCAFSMVGVLGIRAMLRYLIELRRSARPIPAQAEPPISFEALLHREPIKIDRPSIRNYLSRRTVLVTGAGGSIGSELCAQLLDLNPFRLVLVDVSEYNLFQLENALRNRLFEGELEFRIADVRDKAIMNTIFSAYQPDIVFHAAAYKHVPLMERHPVEAFTNNTMSTLSLIRLCETWGAEQFVFVSTDKAVEPTSVLGATKRLAEWYVRAVNAPMNCKTVRFGNVLGSHGSVVPLFTEQIRSGGPITITHPDMTRFFMTANEACCLIMQTLLLDTAPVYTIEMGDPVAIESLARQMAEAILGPGTDLPVQYTGMRPGEKLDEQLWSQNEQTIPSGHPGIIGLLSRAPYSRSELDTYFQYLDELCAENKTAELRRALFETNITAEPATRKLGLRDAH